MTNESNPNQQPGHSQVTRSAPEQAAISPRKALVGVAVVVVVAAVLAGSASGAASCRQVLAERTTELAAPTVIVAAPKAGAPVDSFVLPGNVTALHRFAHLRAHLRLPHALVLRHRRQGEEGRSAGRDCHARGGPATGPGPGRPEYRPGQRQQRPHPGRALHRPRPIRRRLPPGHRHLRQPGRIHRGAVKSAQANVERLRQLQSFEKVYAPFDGVITARNIDTGQLIDPGAGKELFHLQAIQTLRVYANLPQIYSANVKPARRST
jgi:hypothetical protein